VLAPAGRIALDSALLEGVPPVSEPEREDPSESEEGTMERGRTMLVTKPFRSLRMQSPHEYRAPGGASA